MKDDFDVSKLIKKKRKNSKKKGNKFERDLATILNEKFDTKDFCRTPGSGAFATTHTLPEHLRVYGDLITPLNFKYTIESKVGYNKESIISLFNENSILSQMILQARRDGEKSKKLFLLIIKQDYQKAIVVSNDNGLESHLNKVLKFNDLILFEFDEMITLDRELFFI